MAKRSSVLAIGMAMAICAGIAQAGTMVTINNAGTTEGSFTVPDITDPSAVRTFSVDVNLDVTDVSIESCQLKLICSTANILQINSGTYNTIDWDSSYTSGIPVGMLTPVSTGTNNGWVGAVPESEPPILTGHSRLVTLNMEVLPSAAPGTYTLNATQIRSGDTATHENIGGTAGPAFTITIGSQQADPPVITAAVSRKTHGGSSFDVDLLAPMAGQNVAVECREGGPTQLVVTFDQDIAGVDGLDSADVLLASTGANPGSITNVAIAGNQLTIDMNGTADVARLGVSFPGVCTSMSPAAVCAGTICAGVLCGDCTGDASANVFDLVSIRNFLNTSTSPASFRQDVKSDGSVNVLDLVVVRNNLNEILPATCP